MEDYFPILKNLLIAVQIITAVIALIYFIKMNQSYWRWFSLYLILVAILDITLGRHNELFGIKIQVYYAFLVIPLQYLFLIWLFAFKSLSNKKLYIICSLLYVATYLPIELFYKKLDMVYSLNLTTGTLILSFLVVLEFLKQIRSDDILRYRQNKMFYITIGVVLFYIGTYPFFAFYDIISKDEYHGIWNLYYVYFILSNCLMYLLFTVSFIWGKNRS